MVMLTYLIWTFFALVIIVILFITEDALVQEHVATIQKRSVNQSISLY